jgi:hypothetical protein
MSFMSVTPDAVTSAAGHLGAIGSALGEANAAAGPTTGVPAMAADEVSAAVQSIFAGHAAAHQRVSAQVAAFHSQFVSLLNSGAGAYLSAESANARQVLAGGGTPVSAAGVLTFGPGGTTVDTLLSAGPLKITETLFPNRTSTISLTSLRSPSPNRCRRTWRNTSFIRACDRHMGGT